MTNAVTTQPIVLTLPSSELHALLANASVFATSGPERTVRPVLGCVHLVLSDGTLSATATDSYSLLTDTTPCSVTEPDSGTDPSFEVLLDAKALTLVVRALPKSGDPATVEITREAVTFRTSVASIPIVPTPGSFPAWGTLFPVKFTELSEIILNPLQLAKLGKLTVPGCKRGPETSTFSFAGPKKPLTVTFPGRPTLRCLFMPRSA